MRMSVFVKTIWSPMFAVVGFGMNAVDPIVPTMLINACNGVGGGVAGSGIAGSSSARNRPAVGDAVPSEFTIEGEDGKWPPLQLQEPAAQAIIKVGNASFKRMLIERATSVPAANHRRAWNFIAPNLPAQ